MGKPSEELGENPDTASREENCFIANRVWHYFIKSDFGNHPCIYIQLPPHFIYLVVGFDDLCPSSVSSTDTLNNMLFPYAFHSLHTQSAAN